MTWTREDYLLLEKVKLGKINSRMVRRVVAQRNRIARLHERVAELETALEVAQRPLGALRQIYAEWRAGQMRRKHFAIEVETILANSPEFK